MRAMIVLAILLSGAAAFAQDHSSRPALIPGTWKMDLAKSKVPGDLKEGTMTIARVSGDTFRIHTEIVNAAGQKDVHDYTRICDGKERQSDAFRTKDPKATEVCNKQGDEVVLKYDGKVTSTMRFSWAADGQTHTINQTGIGRDGKPFEIVIVNERVN